MPTFVENSFSPRFFLVDLAPTAAAALFLTMLVWAGAPGPTLSFTRAAQTAEGLGASGWAFLAVAVAVAAVLSHPLQLPLLRLLEGYWPRRLGWPAAAGRWRQGHVRRRLARAAEIRNPSSPADVVRAGQAGERLLRRFPPADHLRPTRFGNALAAMEERAGRRYGWDAVVAWPRLYPVLTDRTRAIVDERRDALDTAARFTVTGSLTAVVSVALLARSGWWLTLALLPLAVAILAYGAAVSAAMAYGEAVDTAFDLCRFDLLKALHLPLPATMEAERKVAAALCDLWRQGIDPALRYEHEQPSEDRPGR